MNLDPRPWLRRIGFLPWGISALLFLVYAFVISLAATGKAIGSIGMSVWWLPLWMAQAFGAGRWHPNQTQRDEEDPLPVSSGLVGTCMALAGFGALLHWTYAGAALQLGLPDDVDMPAFIRLVMCAFAVFALGQVPHMAQRAGRYNAAQTRRLVAAESARAAARAQALQSQMQPHFLFNALNTVTALMREDPARGRDVLLRLRALLERSLTTVEQPFILLKQEVAFVQDQLAIEQERFRDRLAVTFDVQPDLLKRQVPAFCIQPLVENALRHGIARSLDGGAIHVRVSRDRLPPAGGAPGAPALRLEVQDTGAGLAPGWREGTGLSNLRQRLAAAYGSAATLTVRAEPGHTAAVVTIPIR